MVIYLCQKHIKWGGSHKNQYREVYKFMRKTVKKLTAVGLTLTSVMGLVACGNNNASTENKSTVDWALLIFPYPLIFIDIPKPPFKKIQNPFRINSFCIKKEKYCLH